MKLPKQYTRVLSNKKKIKRCFKKQITCLVLLKTKSSFKKNKICTGLFLKKKNFNKLTSICVGDFSYKRVLNHFKLNRHAVHYRIINGDTMGLGKSMW